VTATLVNHRHRIAVLHLNSPVRCSMMDEEEEAEGDVLVDQVLAEIGLDATTGLVQAPTAHTPIAEAEPEVVNNVDDLEARMAKLMGA
jgi:hypothetical protein